MSFFHNRHNTYLYEATRHRDIGYQSTIHDLKLLLLRFAQDKSFSSESGGGGPQSNMNLVPYLVHMALYVLNTTRGLFIYILAVCLHFPFLCNYYTKLFLKYFFQLFLEKRKT